MGREDSEIERIRRLRAQQLGSRDPMQGEMRRSQIATGRPRARFSLMDELAHLPAKVTWTLYGMAFGLFVGLWAGATWRQAYQQEITTYAVLFALLISGGAGFVMGRMKDTGKEGWRK